MRSLREQNLLRVVDALRAEGATSRADVARVTGLSRTTVSSLVTELLERGLVVERRGGADGADRSVGRPPVLLSLDPSAAMGIGIDFDHDKIVVALGDLSGSVLAERCAHLDVDNEGGAALDLAAELVGQVIAHAQVDRRRVLGAGVALAGPVDQETGIVREGRILPGWSGRDIRRELAERLGMPAHVDNDANLGALAEARFGAAQHARFAIYVSIAAGIGAGFILDGRPYRGHRGIAGEIGHLLVDPNGSICRCGNRGCLETLATGPALVGLVNSSRGETLDLPAVLEAAADGDAGCRRAIGDAGRAVGQALAAAVSLLGPEIVVIGGDVVRAGDLLLEPLGEALARFALPTAVEQLEVVPGALGDRANLLGALALVVAQSDHAVAARIVQAA